MIKEAINQIHVTFEPWKDYEPIFTFWKEQIEKWERYWWILFVENGRVIKIRCGGNYSEDLELHRKIWLRDFLIKISPLISAGIIEPEHGLTNFNFPNLKIAKEWIDKVIENEGKT